MRVSERVSLDSIVRQELWREALSGARPSFAQRARIILYAEAGWSNTQISEKLMISQDKAALWRKRFLERGLAGLENRKRPGKAIKVTPEVVLEIVAKTTTGSPKGADRWTARGIAKVMGVSEATVRRVWRKHGLKPHLQKFEDYIEQLTTGTVRRTVVTKSNTRSH